MNKARSLNKASEVRSRGEKIARFAATSTGGAAGASLVYDVEDIGTFGDIEAVGRYLPTELDRDEKMILQKMQCVSYIIDLIFCRRSSDSTFCLWRRYCWL